MKCHTIHTVKVLNFYHCRLRVTGVSRCDIYVLQKSLRSQNVEGQIPLQNSTAKTCVEFSVSDLIVL